MQVIFEYGRCSDRLPLVGIGQVDETREYRGREYWHVRPVAWASGSPLPRWIESNPVIVLNAEAPTEPVRASA